MCLAISRATLARAHAIKGSASRDIQESCRMCSHFMFSTSFGKGYSIYQACVHINVKQKQKDQHPGICPRIDELSFAITLYCEKTPGVSLQLTGYHV